MQIAEASCGPSREPGRKIKSGCLAMALQRLMVIPAPPSISLSCFLKAEGGGRSRKTGSNPRRPVSMNEWKTLLGVGPLLSMQVHAELRTFKHFGHSRNRRRLQVVVASSVCPPAGQRSRDELAERRRGVTEIYIIHALARCASSDVISFLYPPSQRTRCPGNLQPITPPPLY